MVTGSEVTVAEGLFLDLERPFLDLLLVRLLERLLLLERARAPGSSTTVRTCSPLATAARPSRQSGTHQSTNRLKCDICEKSFATKHSLKYHFDFVHQKRDKNVQCEFCKRWYFSITELNFHLKNNHCLYLKTQDQNQEKDKEILLTQLSKPDHICSKAFVQLTKLKLHSKTIQKNILKQNCDFCGKLFTQMGTLKKHKDAQIFDMTNFLTKTFVQAFLMKT